MDPEGLFEQCCSEIESAHVRLGHRLGWRFLTCPRSTFVTYPKVALVTLQPGGNRDWFPALPRYSQERGSAYEVEDWGRGVGLDPLQYQVQMFFDALASRVGASSGHKLLAESLSSHFVPFRAPRFKDTPNKRETLAFSRALWTKILGVIHPSLIIVLHEKAFETFSVILENSLGQLPTLNAMPTGWGDYVARIRDFAAGPTLCWFPHWSTYKIFSRAECKVPVDKIIDVLSTKLL
jgi:hypothetical protein